jgi:hypothetical protein
LLEDRKEGDMGSEEGSVMLVYTYTENSALSNEGVGISIRYTTCPA